MRINALIIAAVGALLLLGAKPISAAEYLEAFAREQLMDEVVEAPQATAARMLVPVPRVTIYPNTVITADLLEDMDFGAAGLPQPDVFTVREGLVGKVARQTLLPNTPVPPSAVREPFAVKQGQPAVAVFQAGSLVISATAVPLESGSVGDAISLRNPDSGTTIRGVVQANGTVRVGLP